MPKTSSLSSDINMAGLTFGQLTLVYPTAERIRGLTVWLCHCSCGKTDKATIALLRMGRKKSCGCSIADREKSGHVVSEEIQCLNALVGDDGRPLELIAELSNLSRESLHKLLEGKKKPSLENVARLLKTLGCSWSDLDRQTSEDLEPITHQEDASSTTIPEGYSSVISKIQSQIAISRKVVNRSLEV